MPTAKQSNAPDLTFKQVFGLLDEFEAVQFLTRAPLKLRQKVEPFFRRVAALSNGDDDDVTPVASRMPNAVEALAEYRQLIDGGQIALGPYTPRTNWEEELLNNWLVVRAQLGAPDPSNATWLPHLGSGDPRARKDVTPVLQDTTALALVRPKLLVAANSTPTSVATWGSGVEWVAPGSLSDHALWQDLLGFEAPEKEEELIASVRTHKVIDPILVTGDGCASQPGTILKGHRRRRAAMDARVGSVPVIRRRDLTADAEEEIIVKAAIASTHVRRLAPSKLYALEELLHALYSQRGQGFRSDRTSVGANGSSSLAGDTLTIVASETGAPRNAVANRRKVFGSPVATPRVKDAVDAGNLSLTAAADLVRQVESDDVVKPALLDPNSAPDQIEQGRQKLDAQLRVQLGLPKSKPKPKKEPHKRRRGNAYKLPLDGTPVIERNGQRVVSRRVVGVTSTHVVIEEIDGPTPAPSPPSEQASTRDANSDSVPCEGERGKVST